ncbi:MAG: gfo/Idh/MocA family oxidoreductase [Acidobacteria bacterium]|nr:MAG: gfo/Idh/MocA family oxidoreductase [Acidobacteriota bacterium]
MAKQFGVGVVGLGWVAGAHIDTLKRIPDARVVGISSRRALDPKALESTYGIPLRLYASFEEMLCDPAIDVVDICTPHPLHPDQAVGAARAGKHLIIEKPIALTFEDALRMRQAVKESGVKTCVCFECRFSDHFQLIKSCIDQGLLGKLHYGEVDYYHGIGPWYGQFGWNVKKNFGGSSLLTAGCHALDGLLHFMGLPVQEVTSFATGSSNPIFEPYEYPTTTVTMLKFEDGRIGKVASSIDCLQPYYFHIHLVGSEGSLLDNRIYSHRLKGLNKNRWSILETSLIDSGDVGHHPYLPQFQAFFESARRGVEMPLTSFDDAFETHRVVFAADRSAREGRPVKLDELAIQS